MFFYNSTALSKEAQMVKNGKRLIRAKKTKIKMNLEFIYLIDAYFLSIFKYLIN